MTTHTWDAASTLTLDAARKRVTRGAALLDAGGEWAPQIQLHQLDLKDTCLCVLGQLYGHFTTAVEHLWPQPLGQLTHAADHGFMPFTEDGAFVTACYVLQTAWVEAITARPQSPGAVAHRATGRDMLTLDAAPVP